MSPEVHLSGCFCPTCAAEMNSTGAEMGLDSVITNLRELAEDDRLIIWDPVSKKCLSGRDIEHICVNGNSVQIGLSRSWMD